MPFQRKKIKIGGRISAIYRFVKVVNIHSYHRFNYTLVSAVNQALPKFDYRKNNLTNY